MKKILVTGATGFIGRHVIHRLLASGCDVVASSANVEKAHAADWFGKVDFIPLDLAKLDASVNYYRQFHQPDSLIHLAWEGLPDFKSTLHESLYFPRHAAFLENLVSGGLRDISVAGTCLEYGLQEGCLREDLPAMPTVPYARAKNSLRLILEDLQTKASFTLKWIRLFYMYGKGQNPRSLLPQLDRALSDNEPVFNMSGGEQLRDYLPIERLADYLCRIALQQRVTGIINCCSGEPVKVLSLVTDYIKAQHKSITLNLGYYPYPDYEPMAFWGDTAKLKNILGNA